jgi:hypothetical protein
LEQALGNQSLFSVDQTIVIEELHSLPRSKRKNELIDLIAAATQEETSQTTIILWEKRDLTKTMLKKFPAATALSFKASKKIFNFVEQLNPKTSKKSLLRSLHESVESDGDFFVFSMVCRQVRMLLEVKDGKTPAGSPFIVSKLKSQAQPFSMKKLLSLHAQLTNIDLKLKQSVSALSLDKELDLFVYRL